MCIGVEVGWFRLPVVYRLGDGWVALYGVVLSWVVWWVSWWGDGLGSEIDSCRFFVTLFFVKPSDDPVSLSKADPSDQTN